MAVRVEAPRVTALAEDVVAWFASHQQTDGNLYDPISRSPLPADHYGTMLFAAACTLVRDPSAFAGNTERAVRYFLRVPRLSRGAHELNNLGLLCVLRRWRDSGATPDLQRAIGVYLRRMPFESVTSPATNNWDAMRAVCLAQRSRLLGSAADLRAARECLHTRVLPLQGSDGVFADYPAVDRGGGRATPLTYHAKICAMLAMLLQDLADDAARVALARGVGALTWLCAPNGETTYFGRGCNSLYGYTAAVYAASQALARGIVTDEDRSLVTQAVARMVDLLMGMRQPDGRMRLYPTELDAEQRGWDDYVHRLDYNAFCAFLLLQAPVPQGLPGAARQPVKKFDASDAGLIVRDRDGVFAAFSTRGQFNAGSYLFVDARYSGMQPLTLQYGGRTIIPPPPHDASAPTDPRWIGFMPVISIGDEAYAVRVYDEVRVIDNDFVALVGQGTPVTLRMGLRRRLTKVTREKAGWQGRALARWVTPLVVRLPVRIPPTYAAAPAPGSQVRRAMILLPMCRALCLVDRVDGRFDSAWSTIRLPGRCSFGAHDTFQVEGFEGRLWATSPSSDMEARQVFTSNGPACIIRMPLAPETALVSAVCFAPGVLVQVDSGPANPIVLTVQLGNITRRVSVDLDALRVTSV